ncbi:Vegetative incompatibility protein HET-E-1 [Paramyrothecium foliicola]|nr:Vegetative incompatibility protein HET-E-1 [Paramyrothecium foliicola]
MRLISTSDLKLHTFLDNAIPPYSILSHTWGSEKVSYQEVLQPSSEVRGRTGYNKQRRTFESINSMYAWYRKAEVCIVYLEDSGGQSMEDLSKSNRWFTRGWTIQELIAPSKVIFFSRRWKKVGEKAGNTGVLARITLIHSEALDSRPLQEFSVAEKMKWASDRETTRTEDMAYFVEGITSSDPFVYRGALTRNPGEFSQSMAPITPMYSLDEPFDSTNKGLRLTVD